MPVTRSAESSWSPMMGGTELHLLHREPAGASTALLDTTAVHVEAILAEMLAAPVGGG